MNNMGKTKKFIMDHKKIIIGVVIAVIVVVAGTTFYLKNKKLDVTADVVPTFEGYSGHGTATFNEKSLEKKVQQFVLEKEGVSKEIAEGLVNEKESVSLSVMSKPELSAKVEKAIDKFKTVEMKFDKTSGLKNGDSVTFEIHAGKDVAVKDSKKKFTVKGLKKEKEYSIDDVLKKSQIEFEGFNGSGEIKDFDKDVYTEIEGDGSLKNDDSISLQLNKDYISKQESKGEFLKGDKDKKLKVSGLKDFSTVSNLKDLSQQVDNYAKDENKNYNAEGLGMSWTYDIQRVSSYIEESSETPYSDSNDSKKESKFKKHSFKFVSIYKVTKHEKTHDANKDSTSFKVYGYNSIPYVNDKLKLDSLQDYKYSTYSSYDSEEEAVAKIKNDDSGLVKVDIK